MTETNTGVFNDFIDSKGPGTKQKPLFDFEEKQPRRIAMSIYLKPHLLVAIEKLSKKHGISSSKVVEKILEKSV